MPSLDLDLKPKERSASVRSAKDRYRDQSGVEERIERAEEQAKREVRILSAHPSTASRA